MRRLFIRSNVNALKQQQILLQDEEGALTQEFELLVQARAALIAADADLESDKCKGIGLGAILPNKNYPDPARNRSGRPFPPFRPSFPPSRPSLPE